ncbi:MAG: heavy metal translocating P-type ATPase metal-binding domain-containing protein [Turneriella sp.]
MAAVTGAALTVRAPQVSQGECCAHCGAAAAQITSGDNRFCCQGCAQVYSILRDHNLLGFYDIGDNQIESLRGQPQGDYSYCDTDWFRKLFVREAGAGRYSIRLKLPAIHCAACVWLLEKLPEMLQGVTGARINYLRKEIVLTADAALPVSRLVSFVAELGYVPDFGPESRRSRALTAYDKKLLKRMAVAAFGFGNAMFFSFPEYFSAHVEAGFARTFLGLNILLSAFVLFYSAGEFFANAFRALKKRKIILDLPISAGIIAMFGRSVAEIAAGTSAGYFDTFAGLIFFLLLGRYVQSRSYEWLNFERDNLLFLPLAVRVKRGDDEIITPVQNLAAGDTLRLRNGEIAPTRCRLLSESAQADYAFITGEALPVPLSRGDIFETGGKLTGRAVDLEVLEIVDQSRLNRIWENGAETNSTAGAIPESNFAERVLPYFTGAVISIAVGALLYWLPSDTSRAWNAFSAVLVITCPCALAMAKPFSFFTIQSALARAGLFLKSAATVEKFFSLTRIVFDKTGTLTAPGRYDIHFHASAAGSSPSDSRLIASLAHQSSHPLSAALSTHLGDAREEVADFEEVPGAGTRGAVAGHTVLIGSAAWLEQNGVALARHAAESFTTEVHVAIDGGYKGFFSIGNELRPQLAETIGALAKHHQLALLSGDGDRERARFETIFGADVPLHFSASPAEKAGIINDYRKRGRTMMIGDGLNDAGALGVADIGVAIAEKNSNFSPASDAILSAQSFARLPALMSLAAQARTTAITAYAVSFAYNAIGVSVAVAGNLTPLFCAILMPLSSLSVIALAFISARAGARARGLK